MSNPPHDPAARLQHYATRFIRIARTTHKDHSISSAQYSVMALLDSNAGLTVVELARREGVSHPSMSRLVARLIKLDLVSSTVDNQDKRAKRLSLTPAGQSVYIEIAERRNMLFRMLLAKLRSESVADILEVVEKSALSFEQHFRSH